MAKLSKKQYEELLRIKFEHETMLKSISKHNFSTFDFNDQKYKDIVENPELINDLAEELKTMTRNYLDSEIEKAMDEVRDVYNKLTKLLEKSQSRYRTYESELDKNKLRIKDLKSKVKDQEERIHTLEKKCKYLRNGKKKHFEYLQQTVPNGCYLTSSKPLLLEDRGGK